MCVGEDCLFCVFVRKGNICSFELVAEADSEFLFAAEVADLSKVVEV